MSRGTAASCALATTMMLVASAANAQPASRFEVGYSHRSDGMHDEPGNGIDGEVALLAKRVDESFSLWAPFRLTWTQTPRNRAVFALRTGFQADFHAGRLHSCLGLGPTVLGSSHGARGIAMYAGGGLDIAMRLDVTRANHATTFVVLGLDAAGVAQPHSQPGFIFPELGFKGALWAGADLGVGIEWDR